MERMPNEFQDACYKEVLNNGLEVRIIHKPGFVSSCAYFGTPYGALDAYQIVDGKEVRIPLGSAHFLEHKLFEDEEGDILGQFTRLGANANAFTSYEQTVVNRMRERFSEEDVEKFDELLTIISDELMPECD